MSIERAAKDFHAAQPSKKMPACGSYPWVRAAIGGYTAEEGKATPSKCILATDETRTDHGFGARHWNRITESTKLGAIGSLHYLGYLLFIPLLRKSVMLTVTSFARCADFRGWS